MTAIYATLHARYPNSTKEEWDAHAKSSGPTNLYPTFCVELSAHHSEYATRASLLCGNEMRLQPYGV